MFEYTYKLQIVALYEEEILKKVIEQKIDRTDVNLICPAPGEELPQKADIVFFGPDCDCQKLRERYGAKARFVLCVSHEVAQTLPVEILREMDRIWYAPLSPVLTPWQYKHLIDSIMTEKDYRMSINCLDTAIDTLPDMLWFKSIQGIHTKVNKAFCSIVNKTREDVTGKDHCYIWDVPEDEAYACQESDNQVIRERKTCQSIELVKSNKGLRQFRTYKSPVFSEEGEILGTVGIGHDITDLQNLGAEMEIVLNSMPYSVILRDDKDIIIDVNRRYEEFFNISKDEIVGRSYMDWYRGAFNEQSEYTNPEGYLELEARNTGKILVVYEEIIRDVFDNPVGKISIYRDISNTKNLERKIIHSYNTDFLTGLNNRRSFYNYINKNRGDKPMSVIYLDLDSFKKLNDTFGHKAGDEALVRISNILRQYFSEDFIARFGGDEFVIAVLRQCTMEEIKSRAKLMQSEMIETFKDFEDMRLLTVSIGIARAEGAETSIDELINQGDSAMYKAKQSGKNCCVVYSKL